MIKKILKESLILRESLLSLIVSGIGAGLVFAVDLFFAKLSTPTNYGNYAYIISIISMIIIITSFGSPLSVVSLIPPLIKQRKKEQVANIYLNFKRLIYILSFIGIAFLLLATYKTQDFALYLLSSPLILLLSLNYYRQGLLKALKKSALSRAPDLIARPITILIILIVSNLFNLASLNSYFMLIYFTAGTFSAFVIGELLLTKYITKYIEKHKKIFSLPDKKQLLFSLSFTLLFGLNLSLENIDKIMIKMFISSNKVGLYAIAAKLASILIFITSAVNSIGAPLISETYFCQNKTRLQYLTSKLVILSSLLTIIPVLLLIAFSQDILLIFGKEYLQASSALIILTLCQFIAIIIGPVGFLLNMTGHSSIQVKLLTTTVILSVILNIPAIYYFGIEGAAIATGVSILFKNTLSLFYVKKLLYIEPSILGLFYYWKYKNK